MALRHNKQFLPYLVGDKVYGGGRSFPNLGPSDPTGYKERDLAHKAKRSAVLRRLKAKGKKQYASPDYTREV
jgi:hypothetical protein